MFDDLLPVSADEASYDELIEVIAVRVGELMEEDAGLLFSYMYRLDIDEHKLKHAVKNYSGDSRIRALAELILKRQLLRLQLRKKYGSTSSDRKDEL